MAVKKRWYQFKVRREQARDHQRQGGAESVWARTWFPVCCHDYLSKVSPSAPGDDQGRMETTSSPTRSSLWQTLVPSPELTALPRVSPNLWALSHHRTTHNLTVIFYRKGIKSLIYKWFYITRLVKHTVYSKDQRLELDLKVASRDECLLLIEVK